MNDNTGKLSLVAALIISFVTFFMLATVTSPSCNVPTERNGNSKSTALLDKENGN